VEPACPSDDDVTAYVAGSLASEDRHGFAAHLDDCERCRRLVSALVGSEATLASGGMRDTVGAGDRLGRFELVSLLGRGSMGEVWAARDPDLERLIALKLLRMRPGALGDEPRERLRREAQAMARLHHPNVVAIHELGSDDDGRVFCAMELVEGSTLRDWLETRRPWREIIAALIEVGRGIAAAHAAGLIHRDIKPENILIERAGRPLVSDFGLARLVDLEVAEPPGSDALRIDLTSAGTVIGTPVYMAPEQLAGGVADARSDQFSYCVTIWEAITRTRPFDGDTLSALKAAIHRGPAKAAAMPAALARALRRGMAPVRDDRWPDMTALVDALARIRRRRLGVVVTVAALVAAAAFAFMVVTRGGASDDDGMRAIERAWNPVRATEVRIAFASVGAIPQRAESTIAALDAYRDAWITQRAGVRADAAHRDLQLDCFDRLAQTVDRFVDLLATPTKRDADLAPAMAYRIDPVVTCTNVERLAERSLAPSTPAGRDAERSLRQLELLQLTGKSAEALTSAAALVATATKLGDPELLGRARFAHGSALANAGKLQDAAPVLRQAVQDAAAAHDHYLVAEVWLRLFALVGLELHDVAQANVMQSAVEAAVTQAGDDPRQRADLAMDLGLAAVARGEFAVARDHFVDARQRRIAARGPNHPSVANDETNLGAMYLQLGQLDDATTHLERAIAIISTTLGRQHPVVAMAEHNLASIAARRKDWSGSEARDRDALAIDVAVRGPDAPETARVRVYLARALREQKRFADARAELTKARASLTKSLPATHPEVIELDLRVAQVAEAQGQYAEAEQLARRTVDGLRAANHTGYELTYSTMELARMVAHRDPVASLPIYDEAFTLDVRQKDRDLDGDVESLREFAEAALAAKRPAAALAWFDRMPAAAERLAGVRAKLRR